MLAQELNTLGRAKRGLMVLKELKKNPHRVLTMNQGEISETLVLLTQKDAEILVDVTSFPINDRTSNGSFLADEKETGGIKASHEKIIPKAKQEEEPEK